MDLNVMIVDDFLSDPDTVRRQALSLTYSQREQETYFPGSNSDRPLDLADADARMCALVGERLRPAPGTSHGKARLAMQGDQGKGGVHVDPAHWSGILYLTPNECCMGGTGFFRHKRLGIERAPVFPEDLEALGYSRYSDVWNDITVEEMADPERWTLTFQTPMRYNRLVLFRSYLWHNAGPSFGLTPETARLVVPFAFLPA